MNTSLLCWNDVLFYLTRIQSYAGYTSDKRVEFGEGDNGTVLSSEFSDTGFIPKSHYW